MSATIIPPSKRLCTPSPCAKNEGSNETKMASVAQPMNDSPEASEERPPDRARDRRKVLVRGRPEMRARGHARDRDGKTARATRCTRETTACSGVVRIRLKCRRAAHRTPSRRWSRRSRGSRHASASRRPSTRERLQLQSGDRCPAPRLEARARRLTTTDPTRTRRRAIPMPRSLIAISSVLRRPIPSEIPPKNNSEGISDAA